MNRRSTIAALAVFAVLVFGVWLYRWCQPERQVRRAQGRLLAAAESGDMDSLAQMIAADYRDGWGHDKTFVLRVGKEVFTDFKNLDIGREEVALEGFGAQWTLREKLTVSGFGGPLAMAVRQRMSQIHEPFTMTWRKDGGDWVLTGLTQPEIKAEEMNAGF